MQQHTRGRSTSPDGDMEGQPTAVQQLHQRSDGSSKTSICRGAGAMLTTCQRPTHRIRGMARNPGRHRLDGPPPTDLTMSVHWRNNEERCSLITRSRGSAVPFQARRTHVQP